MSTNQAPEEWIRPDLPSKCTWHANASAKESVHRHDKPPYVL